MNDHENITRALQCADMLFRNDLQDCLKTDNLLIVDSIMECIELAAQIQRKLARMELAIRSEGEA